MKPIQIISQDVFDKIRSRFQNLEMGDETGAVTVDPAAARFFDFDFVNEGTNLGRISISLNDLGGLKIFYSQGITEDSDDAAKKAWYNFLKEMRMFAKRRLLRFDTRDITKSNLDKKDFQYLAKQGTKEQDMTQMNESRWNRRSTKKTSRAVRGTTEVIVRHNRTVDETYPGARSNKKNIRAIFIQNRDGERFKYPFIHPAGAFAMAQHVDHGGIPHDPAGKAIIKMSEQIAQLQAFHRQVQNSQLHDDALGIRDRAHSRLMELKSMIESLSKKHHYENWIAQFNEAEFSESLEELDPVTMEEYKSKFTQKNFKEELANYFPLIHSIMQETNQIDLEEYVKENSNSEETQESQIVNDFDNFVEWAESTEQGKLTDDQISNLKKALTDLSMPLKLDTAYNFFNEFGIDDSDLEDKLEQANDLDPNTDPIDVFKLWANENYPELLVALGLSDTNSPEEPATEPEAATTQPAAENDEMQMHPGTMEGIDRKSMIKEVAKIVKQYYNADNENVGPFRGEEGILIEVEKQIKETYGEQAGEQARMIAEKFMQKLTQEWQDRHGTSNGIAPDGLARLKELANVIKQKVEGIGDRGHGGKDFNVNIMPAEDTSEGQDIAEVKKITDRFDYERAQDEISSVLIRLYDKGHDSETIGQMGDRIAKHLGYDPSDRNFRYAFMASLTDASLTGELDQEPEDDYTDFTMRQGELGQKGVAEGPDPTMGVEDPVVVISDTKTGKNLDRMALSTAVTKYKLGTAQAVKDQLKDQDKTTIGTYTIALPIAGQTVSGSFTETTNENDSKLEFDLNRIKKLSGLNK